MAYLRTIRAHSPLDTLYSVRNEMLRNIENEEGNLTTYEGEVAASKEVLAELRAAVTEHDLLIDKLNADS